MKILSPNKFLRIKRFLKKNTIIKTSNEFGYSESLISRVSFCDDYAGYLKYRQHVNQIARNKRLKVETPTKIVQKTVIDALTVSDIEFMNAVKTVIKYIRSLK